MEYKYEGLKKKKLLVSYNYPLHTGLGSMSQGMVFQPPRHLGVSSEATELLIRESHFTMQLFKCQLSVVSINRTIK